MAKPVTRLGLVFDIDDLTIDDDALLDEAQERARVALKARPDILRIDWPGLWWRITGDRDFGPATLTMSIPVVTTAEPDRTSFTI